jgi:hypothetical protein
VRRYGAAIKAGIQKGLEDPSRRTVEESILQKQWRKFDKKSENEVQWWVSCLEDPNTVYTQINVNELGPLLAALGLRDVVKHDEVMNHVDPDNTGVHTEVHITWLTRCSGVIKYNAMLNWFQQTSGNEDEADGEGAKP